ncbi:MAG: hypothetical protein ACYCX3_10960 [Thermoleophilia bacterium]
MFKAVPVGRPILTAVGLALAAAVGVFCLRCHSPIGDMLGETSPPGGATDGSTLSDIAKTGVGFVLVRPMLARKTPSA